MAYLDNISVFVRVVELGNLSAAGRDMRISPAVASNRIKELEKHLGVRLFNRTTRQLMPTEHGTVFYTGAKRVLEAISEAEAAVGTLSGSASSRIRRCGCAASWNANGCLPPPPPIWTRGESRRAHRNFSATGTTA